MENVAFFDAATVCDRLYGAGVRYSKNNNKFLILNGESGCYEVEEVLDYKAFQGYILRKHIVSNESQSRRTARTFMLMYCD